MLLIIWSIIMIAAFKKVFERIKRFGGTKLILNPVGKIPMNWSDNQIVQWSDGSGVEW